MELEVENSLEYQKIYKKIRENWDKIAKPLDSLGKLEDIIARIGAIQETEHPSVKKSAVIVLCADNGIVEEGISQSDQSVTRICAENISKGKTVVGIMAKETGTDVIAVDMGINSDDSWNEILDRKIRKGTRNFIREKAMTEAEAQKAVSVGTELVKECKEKGYSIICVGEMGIGNTTTSAAVAAGILKVSGKAVAGRGAGLSDEGLSRKIAVIDEAIEKYDLHHKAAFEILCSVGGFDIAGMAGIYLGGKKYGIPVILDGAISMVAALVAEKMEKGTVDFLIPSHKSREPLVSMVSEALGINPVLDAGMALGEGTGAVLMMNIIKTAARVYEESVPFAESNVEQYTRFK